MDSQEEITDFYKKNLGLKNRNDKWIIAKNNLHDLFYPIKILWSD